MEGTHDESDPGDGFSLFLKHKAVLLDIEGLPDFGNPEEVLCNSEPLLSRQLPPSHYDRGSSGKEGRVKAFYCSQ